MSRRALLRVDGKFHEYFEYFEDLFKKHRMKAVLRSAKSSVMPTFWHKYFKAYRKWKDSGSSIYDVGSNIHLIEFASFIIWIRAFEADWNTDENRGEFLKKLRDGKRAPKLLFELDIGNHFRMHELNVHWIPGGNDQKLQT